MNFFAYVEGDPINWIDPWGLSGILTIHSSGTGDGSSGSGGLSGHSWIAYKPDGTNVTTTFGTWGNNPFGLRNGMHKNLELGRQGDASRSIHLDDEQECALLKLIEAYRNKGEDTWGYFSPCASFASEIWKNITGEYLNPYGPYSNPSTLKESMIKTNSSKENVSKSSISSHDTN